MVHAGQLYSRTDSTVLENSRSLNILGSDNFHILFRLLHALHAAALHCMSSAVIVSIDESSCGTLNLLKAVHPS